MPEFQGKVRLTANPFDLIGADIDVSNGTLALIVSNQEVGEWPLHSVAIDSAIDGFHVKVDGEEFIFSTRDADAFAAAVGISRFGSRGRKPGRSAKAVTALKSSGLVQTPAPTPAAPTPAAPTPAPVRVRASPKMSKAKQFESPIPAPILQPVPPKPIRVKRESSRQPVRDQAVRRVKAMFATKEVFGARRLIGFAVVIGLVALGMVSRPLLAGLLLVLGLTGALLAGAATVDPLLATRLPESWPAGRLAISAVAMLAIGVMLLAI